MCAPPFATKQRPNHLLAQKEGYMPLLPHPSLANDQSTVKTQAQAIESLAATSPSLRFSLLKKEKHECKHVIYIYTHINKIALHSLAKLAII